MKFYNWEIFTKLQLQNPDVIEDAEEEWNQADENYNKYLEENHELFPSNLIALDFHDHDLMEITLVYATLQLHLKNKNTNIILQYEDVTNTTTLFHKIPSYFP